MGRTDGDVQKDYAAFRSYRQNARTCHSSERVLRRRYPARHLRYVQTAEHYETDSCKIQKKETYQVLLYRQKNFLQSIGGRAGDETIGKTMKIIIIENDVFDLFFVKVEYLLEKLNQIYNKENLNINKIWLDAQDVCLALNISKRQLQTYRNSGRLPYTKIGKKYFYNKTDIEQLIKTI